MAPRLPQPPHLTFTTGESSVIALILQQCMGLSCPKLVTPNSEEEKAGLM